MSLRRNRILGGQVATANATLDSILNCLKPIDVIADRTAFFLPPVLAVFCSREKSLGSEILCVIAKLHRLTGAVFDRLVVDLDCRRTLR